MSFRTDAFYQIVWPDGTRSITPLQFLKRGETITPKGKLFPSGMLVKTEDSAMRKDTTEQIIAKLNTIAASLEARAPQQVRDARPTPTREQADAVDFEQRAEEWRAYFAGRGPRPELPVAPRRTTYDPRSARESDEFLDGVRRARKQLRERR